MRIVEFRVGGSKYTGAEAKRMHYAALPWGYDEVSATSQMHPTRDGDPQHYILAVPAGVAACVELAFDTREEMLAWACDAELRERNERDSVKCYRAIIGHTDTTPGGGDG